MADSGELHCVVVSLGGAADFGLGDEQELVVNLGCGSTCAIGF